MSRGINHPSFGKVVRSEFGDELMTFRQFPFLKEFWVPDSKSALSNPYLSSEHRNWVIHWEQHIEELSQVSRQSPVHSALQSQGVFEVSIAIPPEGKVLKSQELAYKIFIGHEEKICANMVDSLLRYFRFAREQLPDWFDEDHPRELSPGQIGEFIGFDGFSICRSTADGVSALRAGWDPEHGLLMGIYKDQVIAIGTDEVDEILGDPQPSLEYYSSLEYFQERMWGHNQMTLSEQEALQQFSVGHTSADDMEF